MEGQPRESGQDLGEKGVPWGEWLSGPDQGASQCVCVYKRECICEQV